MVDTHETAVGRERRHLTGFIADAKKYVAELKKTEKIKNLQQEVTKLTSVRDGLHSQISSETALLLKLQQSETSLSTMTKKERYVLKNVEMELTQKELELMRKKKRVAEVSAEEATLEAKAQALHAQIEPVEDLLPVHSVQRGTGYHSVYDLLEKARDVLGTGNVREAGRLLKEAQKLQRKLSLAENDERKLRYDLLEIETDIKLATL